MAPPMKEGRSDEGCDDKVPVGISRTGKQVGRMSTDMSAVCRLCCNRETNEKTSKNNNSRSNPSPERRQILCIEESASCVAGT